MNPVLKRLAGPFSTKLRRRLCSRVHRLEMLERRDLLAAAIWHNSVHPLDVTSDQPAIVSPRDALLVINWLNDPSLPRQLPRQIDTTDSPEYVDTNCDGNVSPIDVLLVINHINTIGSGIVGGLSTNGGSYAKSACSPQLKEGSSFSTELTRVLKVPRANSAVEVRFEAPEFDIQSRQQIRDAFEIRIFDVDGRPLSLPYRQDVTSVFNWSEGFEPVFGSGTSTSIRPAGQISTATIDLSHLQVGFEFTVGAQLVNNDTDDNTSVIIRGFEFVDRPTNSGPQPIVGSPESSAVPDFDLPKLSDVSGSVQANYGRTTLSGNHDRLSTELTVTNLGSQTILSPLLVVLENFSQLDAHAFRPDGILPDGRPFFDLTSQLVDGVLAPGQSVSSNELQFLNQSGQRFTFGLKTLGNLNLAPSRFASTPVASIEASKNYRYQPTVEDPEGQPLRFSKVTGPDSMQVDSTTGLVTWDTAPELVGSHRVTLRATDPYGMFVEQSFTLAVLSSLQNRPPNFVTDPVTDAIASSGFEITTVATGAQPAGVTVINGFRGPGLVTLNKGDQSLSQIDSLGNDRFELPTRVSVGEPAPDGQVLRSGYSIDVGLPAFEHTSDRNEINGMDQADLNGDGTLDFVVSGYILQGPLRTQRQVINVTLGNPDGTFGEAVTVAELLIPAFSNPDYNTVRVEDFDNDGLFDILTTDLQTSTLRFLRGNGQGGFADVVTTTLNASIAHFKTVDLDQDGSLDLVGMLSNQNDFGYLLGNEDGTFADFVNVYSGTSINFGLARNYAVEDMDGDGDLDIVLGDHTGRTVNVLANDGALRFEVVATLNAWDPFYPYQPVARDQVYTVFAADFNGDGKQDIAYTTNQASSNAGGLGVYLGDGSGSNFVYQDGADAMVRYADNAAGNSDPVDLDNDGDLDIVLASSTFGRISEGEMPSVLINRGDGTFTTTNLSVPVFSNASYETVTHYANAKGVLVGDYNQDGVLDLSTYRSISIGNFFASVTVILADRPGVFASSSNLVHEDVVNAPEVFFEAGDFNNDGIVDLWSPRYQANSQTWLGRGDGTFDDPFPATPSIGNEFLSQGTVQDFNRDGNLDVFWLGGNGVQNGPPARYLAALGNGDGTFEITFREPMGRVSNIRRPDWSDFNGDGYLDFAASNEFGVQVFLYDVDTPGTWGFDNEFLFSDLGPGAVGHQFAMSIDDFDLDGNSDIAMVARLTDEPFRLVVYPGLGDGTFASPLSTQFAEAAATAYTNPSWMATGDFNEDGIPDVAVSSYQSISVHQGLGDGKFGRVDIYPAYNANGCCMPQLFVRDIDYDGHDDVLFTSFTSGAKSLAVLPGNGDGSFRDRVAYDLPSKYWGSVAFGDLDNDGRDEIVSKSQSSSNFATIITGVRQRLTDIISIDLNGDGNDDVLATYTDSSRVKWFLGDNLGNLNRQADLFTDFGPVALTVSDLNGNGSTEIITANRSARSVSIFSGGVDNWTRNDIAVGQAPIDVVSGLVDGDAVADLLVIDEANNALWVLSGKGDNSFRPPVSVPLGDRPNALLLADVDADGKNDVVISLPESNRLMILRGDGQGGFAAPQYVALEGSPSAIAAVDFNQDGNLDFSATLKDQDQVAIIYGRGRNQFARPQLIAVGEHPVAMTAEDADDDGRIDLIVSNQGDNTVSVIYNRFDPNEVYRYDADAVDPDNDPLIYSIVDGPGGLIINSDTGALLWAASPDQVGVHSVTLSADDGRGGVATQSYKIDVQPARDNASPLIATEPDTTIGANEVFTYQATVLDGDNDAVRYRLLDGLAEATIDSTTGLVTWDGRGEGRKFSEFGEPGSFQIAKDASFQTPSVTVEGWFNIHTLTASNGGTTLFYQQNSFNVTYFLGLLFNNTIRFIARFGPSQEIEYRVPFIQAADRWYHFALTIDDASRKAIIYVDGEVVGERTLPESLDYSGTFPLTLNGGQASVDHFRVWSVARSQAEIQQDMKEQYNDNPLVTIDLRFDKTTSHTAHDSSLYQNDGYLVPGPGWPQPTSGLANPGQYSFTIGVDDGRGGYDEQTFELEILPELRGSIVGHLFDDLNGDGDRDNGSQPGVTAEPSLAGWLLYIDTNGNAYPDPSERQTTTDANGNYQFRGLLPGTHPLRVDPVAGYETPSKSDAAVTANQASVFDLAIEQLSLSHIRGQLRTEDGDAIAYWKAYADLDLDGTRDDNEPMAQTDRNGNYALTGLAAGTYTIRTDLPAGWADTAGRDGKRVTLAANQISSGNNFVLEPTNTSVTGGVHFVTMPNAAIEARQVFRYASVAMGISDEPISYDLSLAPDGMVIDPNAGLVAWRPTIDQVGEHLVILRATDASGSIALHDFYLNVTAPNTPPVIIGIGNLPAIGGVVILPAIRTAYVGRNYRYDVFAQDAESTTLIYALTSAPVGASIDPSTGRLSWTPAASAVGSQEFTLKVTDEAGASTTASWTVNVQNASPTILPLEVTLPRSHAAVSYNYFSRISAQDALGRPVTWTITSGPTGLTVASDGTLRWTPLPNQLGTQVVQLLATTADGATESVLFNIEVLGRALNAIPSIDSEPTTSVTLGQPFEYQMIVSDSDRDIHAFTLLDGPVGMSIHPSLGFISWTPAADQLGEHDVRIQVSDPWGDVDEQAFQLKVSRFGGPPRIVSVPPTEANVGSAFLYSVRAVDREDDPLTYALLTAPAGMTIVETTGEIAWTPTTGQVGQQNVAIQVSDGIGGAETQVFAINVSAGVPNLPPLITSSSPRFGAVGTAFSYTLVATDPENTAITYSLSRGPAGMNVNASSGLVTWTPAVGQAGKHVVTLIATDAGGASAIESFEFDVLAQNKVPVINSTARAELAAGELFRYDVLATDPDVDLLRYQLSQAPSGAEIDAFGRIRWETDVPLIGSHDFVVKVTDTRGGEAMQSFTVRVIEDRVAPKLSLIVVPGDSPVGNMPWGPQFKPYVKAIDNVAIRSLTLEANGRNIPLDAAGTATFTFEEWRFQSITAKATAIDTNGNTTTSTTSFAYDVPEGWIGEGGDEVPTAIISTPTDAESVTGMVSITGTAAHTKFDSFRLSYRHVDDTAFTQFHTGNTQVQNGVLGVWDTSLLLNDEYVIRLEVVTKDGVVNVDDRNIGLAGELKLGNFRLSFTDMVIPVAGIPIEITRIYDTLQANREGDFGYGWRLEYRNTDLRVGLPKSGLEDIGIYSALRPGVKVYLNVPGEGRQGFTFTPDIRVLPGLGRDNNLVLARPRFTPDPGVTSTLSTGISNYLLVNEQGELYAPGGIPYNPGSPDFGGAYVLATREGISYRVDGTSGKLTSANDRNGNQLKFDESGISTGNRRLITLERDQLQRIVRIVGPSDDAISYVYEGRNLVRFSDQEGFATTYEYDAQNRLLEVIDPLERPYARTTYGPDGRLLSVTDANGRTINFTHSGETNQQIIEDSNGSLTVLEYDSLGRIVQETDPMGGVTRREFDSAGRVLVEVDPRGARVTNRYDARGNLIYQMDRNGNIIRLNYDSQNLPNSLTSAGGQTTQLRYNAEGLLTTRLSEDGEILESIEYDNRGNPIRKTNAAGQSERMEYNDFGVAVAMEDALGRRIELKVNAMGLSTGQIDASGNSLVFKRDSRGLVTDILGSDGKVVQRRFNAAGELIGMTTPSGGKTQFAVDALGNETLLADANGRTQLRAYNLTGDLISLTNEKGSLTRYEYDVLGRRTKTIHPDGSTEEFVYDSLGNLVQSTDALRNVRSFEYDAERQLVLERDALGRETRYDYDADGRTTRIVGPDASIIEYAYDTVGNRIRIVLPDGKAREREFDRVGNLVAEIDPAGRTRRYVYDAAGQLTSVIEPGGGVSRYAYDGNGNLIRQVDPLGNVTSFEYDGYNQLVSKTYPSGDRETYGYDIEGWQTSTTTANGSTIIVHDRNGNVLERRFTDGTQESFTYSATNQVLSATNEFGTITMTYDGRDRLAVVRYPDDSEVRYGYDANGNRTSVTAVDVDGNMHQTTYRYDAVNRLLAVRDSEEGETLYEYDTADRITAVSYPNDMRTAYRFSEAGYLEVIETTLDGTTIERLRYTFGESYERSGVAWLDGRTTQFTYDATLRLTSETQLAGDQSVSFRETYSYDLASNRRSIVTSNGDTQLLSYNANNQIQRFGDREFTYDSRGRLTLENGTNHRVQYGYDAEDQLVRVEKNGTVVEYLYDALGNRVAEIHNGSRTNYLLDFQQDGIHQVLAEYPVDQPFSVEYVYGHQRISRADATGKAYFHYDASQNVIGLSNSDGEITDRYVMTAFGELLVHIGVSHNPYQFASERVDSQNGLVHMRSRDYAPVQGRFLSRDPFAGLLADPLSLHRYQYAHQNPISNTDPTGEFTLAEQAKVGALIGGLSSAITGVLSGKKPGVILFETFVGAAFGAVGGQFGGALSKAFATQFMQGRVFTTIISNPIVLKYSPRLVYAIPNTVLSIAEDLTKGFGTGSFRDPGFAEGVAFSAAANFFFNILVGPGEIGVIEVQRAVPTGRRLGETGADTYQIFTRAAREKAAPKFKEMVSYFADGNFTQNEEYFLTFLNETTKFLVGQVISIHASK